MGLSTNIGLRALLTSQSALDTIGHNVANATTEGYSRQRVLTSSARPVNLRGLQLGNGVDASVVTRSVDELLNTRIVGQSSSVSRLESQLTEMASVEALLNEPGEGGFGALMDSLFSSLSLLSASPEDAVARNGALQSTEGVTRRFHQVSGEIRQLQGDAQLKAETLVADVNLLADRLVSLNEQISQVEASSGTVANDLRDQRGVALRALAERVEITARENAHGAVLVQVDGQLLVGSGSSNHMRAQAGPNGAITLQLRGGVQPVEPQAGQLAGVVAFSESFANEVLDGFDRYARGIVLEMNRAHSTGVPLGGGFNQLRSDNPIADLDGDGAFGDVLLRDADLPFEVNSGELYVHVAAGEDGDFTTTRLQIDPERMTVQGFVDALSGVSGLAARIDASGRLNIDSLSQTKFHFGKRLDRQPDNAGVFGGDQASHVSSFDGPFSIGTASTLELVGSAGPFTLNVDPASFAAPGQPTASELAASFNASPDMAANNLRAVAVGDRLGFQSLSTGAGASFQLTGGTAASSLGLTVGTYNGQELAVDVGVTGAYGGADNGRWTFTPIGTGTIGTTPRLEVEVRDEAGALVTTLDVGEGYSPGTSIAVADGLSVSFSVGEINGGAGDVFTLDTIADSDSSDVLVALGLNSLFTGSDAATISLREEIANDPALFAGSSTGEDGDNGAILKMLEVQSADIESLDGSLGTYFGSMVGGVGFEVASTSSALEVESFMLSSLEQQREQVSGVNVDEELVKMIEFEQSYQAAARFLQVVGQLNDTVMALV
ncbi:MAG: flagellar hook-associated protein FlgK [Planctomycetota bacterium]|nr:flagellar hook-associated protein FlgK [Planctomycetota bacterium]